MAPKATDPVIPKVNALLFFKCSFCGHTTEKMLIQLTKVSLNINPGGLKRCKGERGEAIVQERAGSKKEGEITMKKLYMIKDIVPQ